MAPEPIAFYFDYLSPYAYLAWARLRELGVVVRPQPVVFGALLDHGGQLGPAEIPAKRAWLIRDCLRIADRMQVAFTFPRRHPFRSLDALRVSLREVSGERQHDVIDALWRASWQHGDDLGDPAVLARVIGEVGLDAPAVAARISQVDIKARLRADTQRAIEAGVFGVPSFGVAGEIVWGNDRIDDALALARGGAKLDPARVAALASTPIGLARTRRGAPLAPASPEAAQRVAAVFSRAKFMTALGVELVRVGDGVVDTELAVRDDHLQQDGFVHAAVVAAMADHTAGAAAGTRGRADSTPLTVEYKINLLRPATGVRLRCRATVLKAGRTLTIVESEVSNDAGKLVAKATVTLAIVEAPT